MELTYLRDLTKEFNLTEDQLYQVFLRHGNRINTKLLHTIDGKIVIPSVVYVAIQETVAAMSNSLTEFENIRELATDVIPIKECHYIYYLFFNRELVYIGQSCALGARINTHQKDGKVFNRVYNERVDTKIALLKESFYIHRDIPKLNIDVMDNSEYLQAILSITCIDIT